jgi:HD-GYP domain-containing protein (c-di-GMP phosphodiesterase class II)
MDSTYCATIMLPAIGEHGVLEPKRKAFLIPQFGGEPVVLDSPELILGRGEGLDLRLRDTQASRRHARILAVHNRYYVQDLASTNGTFLNGYRVANERLAHGDLVQFGASVFRFEMGVDLDADYLRKLDLRTVTSLAEAVDKKDAYTHSHSEAVGRLAQRLALELGFSSAAAERVRIAGRLHDIGKIGVPDSVLCKPGPLGDSEYALIRKHPSDGEAILAPLDQLADLLPVVRHHHERFDGRGYPDGLAGEAIAVEARIVQVADTYHAMSSSRPYRAALDRDRVRGELERNAGTQFDPEIVRAFIRLMPSLNDPLAEAG